jgi:hypothetical protein
MQQMTCLATLRRDGQYGDLTKLAHTNIGTWPNRLTPIWVPDHTGLRRYGHLTKHAYIARPYTAAVVLTGLLGSSLLFPILKMVKAGDPITRGLATSSSAHGLGTAALVTKEPEALPYCALGGALHSSTRRLNLSRFYHCNHATYPTISAYDTLSSERVLVPGAGLRSLGHHHLGPGFRAHDPSRGVGENQHSTDVDSPPPHLRSRMSIHPEGDSCPHLGSSACS